VTGSVFSMVGVCFGVVLEDVSLLPPALNQNLFLFAELPELGKKLEESDAESGLFSRLNLPRESSVGGSIWRLEPIASAVLGLCAGPFSLGSGEGVDLGAGLPQDVMLPVKEWFPRIVDVLPSVSEEIIDNGRGITSIVSENPTRVRVPVAQARRCGEVGGVLLCRLEIDWLAREKWS
jgi:hypothetical protein